MCGKMGVVKAVCLLLAGVGVGVLARAYWPRASDNSNPPLTALKPDAPDEGRPPTNPKPPGPAPDTRDRPPALTRGAATTADLGPLLGGTPLVVYQLSGCRGVYVLTKETNKPDPRGA